MDLLDGNAAVAVKVLGVVTGLAVHWANAKFDLKINETAITASTVAFILGVSHIVATKIKAKNAGGVK